MTTKTSTKRTTCNVCGAKKARWTNNQLICPDCTRIGLPRRTQFVRDGHALIRTLAAAEQAVGEFLNRWGPNASVDHDDDSPQNSADIADHLHAVNWTLNVVGNAVSAEFPPDLEPTPAAVVPCVLPIMQPTARWPGAEAA